MLTSTTMVDGGSFQVASLPVIELKGVFHQVIGGCVFNTLNCNRRRQRVCNKYNVEEVTLSINFYDLKRASAAEFRYFSLYLLVSLVRDFLRKTSFYTGPGPRCYCPIVI